MKIKLLFAFSLLCLVVVVNYGIWNVFFQQDEWYWFGQVLIAQKGGIGTLLHLSGFHFNPFYALSFYLFYSLFNLHWQAYAICSLILQTINALLLFILIQKITKQIYTSFVSSIFFVIANSSQQAVTWYAASLNVLPAAMFGLLSLIYFLFYYENKKIRYILISYAALLVSLGFKEDALFFFPIYIIAFVLIKKIKNIKLTISTVLLAIAYFVIRGLIQKYGPVNPISHISLLPYLFEIFKNAIYIPLSSFSQLFISPLMVYNFGHFVTTGHENFFLRFSYIKNIDIFIETTFFTIVTIILTIILVGVLGIGIKKMKVNERKRFLLILLFTIFSFSPFFLLPSGFGMESRHYYFPLIGGSTLFGCFTVFLMDRLKKNQYRYLLLIGILFFFSYHIALDWQQLQQVIDFSKSRIEFTHQIKKIYSHIPQNSIFLSEGDTLPFQSGMGQMLMVIFSDRYQFNYLLSDNFLWNMGSQGYERKNGEAFGYFTDENLLKVTFRSNRVSVNHLYALYWDNKDMKLTDVSQKLRSDILKYE